MGSNGEMLCGVLLVAAPLKHLGSGHVWLVSKWMKHQSLSPCMFACMLSNACVRVYVSRHGEMGQVLPAAPLNTCRSVKLKPLHRQSVHHHHDM